MSVFFSLEGEASPEVVATNSVEAVAVAPLTTGRSSFPGNATQPLSMVLVGSLLIGLGSVVRRSV